MWKWLSLVFVSILLIGSGVKIAQAEDSWRDDKQNLRNVLLDTLYGAISAPQSDPDWGANIGAGVAIGAVGGLVYGVATEGKDLFSGSRALLEFQQDKMKVSLPEITTKVEQSPGETPEQTYSVSLLQFRF